MSDKDFGELVENEVDAFVDHMTGPYDSKQRDAWVDARDECRGEFWRRIEEQQNSE